MEKVLKNIHYLFCRFFVFQKEILSTHKLCTKKYVERKSGGVYLYSSLLNTVHRRRINKYKYTVGSSWHAPLSNLKYFVIFCPFTMHDSWLFNSVFIHLINVFLNPYRFKLKIDELTLFNVISNQHSI